jgi:hypothetical protein
MAAVTIEHERIERGGELADIAGLEANEVDAAILAQHGHYRPDRRNTVSTLALVAQLAIAPASSTTVLPPVHSYQSYWPYLLMSFGMATGPTRRYESLNGRVPKMAQPGDILVGGDYGGARIDIRVVETIDGSMTCEVVPGHIP